MNTSGQRLQTVLHMRGMTHESMAALLRAEKRNKRYSASAVGQELAKSAMSEKQYLWYCRILNVDPDDPAASEPITRTAEPSTQALWDMLVSAGRVLGDSVAEVLSLLATCNREQLTEIRGYLKRLTEDR